MAAVIQLKRSSTQNDTPTTSDLVLGELAVNTYDGKLFMEKNDGSASIVEVGTNPSTLSVNSAYSFPTSDGSNGQVLSTNGSGTLSFTQAASSGISIFKYTITSTSSTLSGADDDNNTLSYDVGSEQVYLNGVLLADGGDDYTATNTSTITFENNVISGDIVQVVAITSVANLVQGFFTANTFTATTADQVLSSLPVVNKAVKYVINATHASAGTHAAEVLLINNGSNAFFVQYGDVYSSSSLFSLSADVSSGNMRLLITPVNTNTTVDTFQIRHQ